MIDVVRLGKLIGALNNANEGERNAAAGMLYGWMVANHVHPDDVVVDVKGERDARFDRLMQRFEDENTKLRKENAFFVEHADPNLRAKAQKAGLIESRGRSSPDCCVNDSMSRNCRPVAGRNRCSTSSAAARASCRTGNWAWRRYRSRRSSSCGPCQR